MSPQLLSPTEAATVVAKRLNDSWAERICAELAGEPQQPIEVGLRPGVGTTAAVERVGYDAWSSWHLAWSALGLDGVPGLDCQFRGIRVRRVESNRPWKLSIGDLDAGRRLLALVDGVRLDVDIDRIRTVGTRLKAVGATLTPATLRAACRLSDDDVEIAAAVTSWVREQSDLSGWTLRQLPVPGLHTKWLATHALLIEALLGRDVRTETRPRLSVVHLTYVDPDYLATGQRRHDAWTTGDNHDLAYRPRVVVMVENRDCRVWFPPMTDTVVVEGAGKAAAASLSRIDWLVKVEHLVYWGDIDSDGFAILDGLRAELAPLGATLHSILMDTAALARYERLGVDRDRFGNPLKPSARRLPHLTEAEAACYGRVATAGEVTFRRIEQERINLADAVEAVRQLIRFD